MAKHLRVATRRANAEKAGIGGPLNRFAEVLPPRFHPQALLWSADRDNSVFDLHEQLEPDGIGAFLTAFPVGVHCRVAPKGQAVSSDPNDLGVDEFHNALEGQGNEAEAGEELIDFFTTDRAEMSGHDGSPGTMTCGNEPPGGVLESTISYNGVQNAQPSWRY